MFVVDTNVLLYAANRDSPFHDRCAGLLAAWRAQPEAWFVTWGICYEFLRVATHPRVLEHPWSTPSAWDFIDGLISSPGLVILQETDRHAKVAETVFDGTPGLGGNLVHDAHTAILMREHGIRRIVTRDTDFHRFGFLEPIDPMA